MTSHLGSLQNVGKNHLNKLVYQLQELVPDLEVSASVDFKKSVPVTITVTPPLGFFSVDDLSVICKFAKTRYLSGSVSYDKVLTFEIY